MVNMGNFVSHNSFYLLLKRAATRYNAENRAYKELKRQEKFPVAAPKYDAGIINYQKSMIENKNYLAEVVNKNTNFNERLKDVYVTSKDETSDPQSKIKSIEKPLPTKRTSDFFELGYKESKIIPIGKVSLMQTMKFISDHHMNGCVWTAEKIANENTLKKEVVDDILKYFYVYEMFIPGQMNKNLIGEKQPKTLTTTSAESKNKQ